MTVKKLLLILWNAFFDAKKKLSDSYFAAFDFFYKRLVKPPPVKSVDETLDKILAAGCSVSRFGDGEIKLLKGKSISFQTVSPLLKKRLKEVLKGGLESHIVGIPDIFGGTGKYTQSAADHWQRHLRRFRRVWYKNLSRETEYYDALMTRSYLTVRDKSQAHAYFQRLRLIWKDRDVVFVEGRESRLGVGNDLFGGAKSVRRILCPNMNAFDRYGDILEQAKKIEPSALILIALGPAATVLAYDLHKAGYQAIDIGHADIEYEWFLRKATKKIPVENKFVNEAGQGRHLTAFHDEKYEAEIIAKIGD